MRPFPILLAAALGAGLAAPLAAVAAQRSPQVTTDVGTLAGTAEDGVLVFRGVPYAAPPVGPLRWRAPQPVARWTGVRPATALGSNCVQHRPYSDVDPSVAGVSEDCLYLNVWTAALGGAPRPVMVWIHGGGFFAGFGGEARHDGAVLARKGAVVVTLNYRLGPFGYLAHPALASPDAPAGNYGPLDQVAALRWVRQNIAHFGGDPNRVTIFGESAGAQSVATLLASPLARGLFHRAIMQSGAGVGGGYLPRDSALAEGRRLAEALGISGAGAAARLRALNADTLLGRWLAAISPEGGFSPRLARTPVVDGRLLPRPIDSLLAAGAARVPIIVGSNAEEDDVRYGAPARSLARFVTARGGRAWVYQFTRAGTLPDGRRYGPVHSADIVFAFGRPRPILAEAGRAPYDSALADVMSDYWLAFAATGDPNGAPRAGARPRWPAYDRRAERYLELGARVGVGQALRRARYDSLDAAARAAGELRPR